MSGWHELKAERNRQSLARLNKALPTIFPSGVLSRARERPHFQIFVNGHVTEQLAAFRDENEAARRLGVRRQTRHVLACFGKTT
jgi:hypothetical protein